MFQSVRVNSPIYIYHKDTNPRLEIGYITVQPTPRPKYTIPPSFGSMQDMVVDLVVKIGSQTFNFNGVPAQSDVADSFSNGESVFIADNRDAMNSEILNIKQKSIDILNSKEAHENIISSCNKILAELNPEYAEKETQKQEIETLKVQMSNMSKTISDLLESNKELIQQLKIKEDKK